jgi:outer membrane protein OmpA-like peptidoglycan-associated protein
MKGVRRARVWLLSIALAGAAPSLLSGQGMLDRVKAKAKAKVDAETDKALDKGLDNVAKCVMGDAACIKAAQDAGKPVTVTDKKGNKVSTADSAKAVQPAAPATVAPAAAPAPDAASAGKFTDGIALNFDFTPGDKVFFFEDFANDKVGDLPERLDVTSGNFSVATHKGRKALVNTEGGTFTVKLPQVLPDRFTIEMEYHLHTANNPVKVWTDPNRSIQLGCWQSRTDIYWFDGGASKQAGESVPGGEDQDIATCRYMVDKGYAKAYWGGTRTAQLNGLATGRADKIEFEVPGTGTEDPFILYNVRIAAGGKKLWDAISAAGRATVNGILFDTGSDHIRAESTPVLKDIAGMLRDHAELKLLVEGHTDNVGSAPSNLALSDKRAAAVKAWLVEKEQIAATRLTTKGLGDTKPAVPNTSAEGRQNNRRVELVKQP